MATILVAIEVEGASQRVTEQTVLGVLDAARRRRSIDSWWIAEDYRNDRSDCDSAIFVPMGTQNEMRTVISNYIINKELEGN